MNKWERFNLATEAGIFSPVGVYADFGTVLSVGGSLLGASMQSDAAGDAAQAQSEATGSAIGEQARQFNVNRKDLEPWRNAGGAAVNKIAELLGLEQPGGTGGYTRDDFLAYAKQNIAKKPGSHTAESWADSMFSNYKKKAGGSYADDETVQAWIGKAPTPQAPTEDFGALNKKFTLADFWDDPITKASFDFGLAEGTKALGNMAGARGNRNSGAQLKALERFATDYTGTKAGESYNRFYGDQDRTYNRLAGVSGTGQTAATNTAQLGQNSANTISGLISGQGNARGAAAIAGSNAMASGIQNAGNTIANWFNRNKQPNGGYGAMDGGNPWGIY